MSVFVITLIVPSQCNTVAVGSHPKLSAERNANARTIADVALHAGLGPQGALVGITAALTESGLDNLDYGDVQNGVPTSSRGLFQQLEAWGPLEDRLDPRRAAIMFYTGGQHGQPGLIDIAGWQQLSVPAAAQAVQQSEFKSGSNYAANLEWAQSITESVVLRRAERCQPQLLSLVHSVRLPHDPNVAAEARGAVIGVQNAALAAGINAGLTEVGQPYVWGGSGDDGCARGGGDFNSCQGIVGWDCSGLVRYVLLAAGAADPGTDSAAQRNNAFAIPWERGQPGDIVGFPGHVAVYLGKIGGTEYLLEASEIGVPVRIVPLTRQDHDPGLYRYWSWT